MKKAHLDFRNTNTLWSSVFIETLVRMGLSHAVISPGSRSTPLTMALARHPALESIPVLDERSAGFFALGLARRLRKPVLLLCTSGTAGANYFPAVIEASESGVPLIIVTADRPPEMRDCSSGQTIDQQKLFGSYPIHFHELAVPEAKIELLRYLRQALSHAWTRALNEHGVVHLNQPFRDPLPPLEDESTKDLMTSEAISENFFSHLSQPFQPCQSILLKAPPTQAKGIVVAGASCTGNARHIVRLAKKLGWPLLADALSPVRQADRNVITSYDCILRNPEIAEELRPQSILCFGGWPTSKVLRAWISESGADITMVSPLKTNVDPLHAYTRQITAEFDAIRIESPRKSNKQRENYLKRWIALNKNAQTIINTNIGSSKKFFEGEISKLLSECLPSSTPLFVANSMPVRDMESFLSPGSGIRVFFNRGANGIDGTLSTALGVAHGADPTVLLSGDLALLHDSNGFLLKPHFKGSLTILLINNQGGGIFEQLPIAEFTEKFEKFWATPQNVNFSTLCQAHGIPHTLIKSRSQLRKLLQKLPKSGIRVFEIQTDRKHDCAFRRNLFLSTADSLA